MGNPRRIRSPYPRSATEQDAEGDAVVRNGILLVAADESVATGLAELLDASGAPGGLARIGDFDTALTLSPSAPYEVCLLDARTPGGDALDLIHYWNSIGARWAIILLLEEEDPELEAAALRSGADDILTRAEWEHRLATVVRRTRARHRRQGMIRASRDRLGHLLESAGILPFEYLGSQDRLILLGSGEGTWLGHERGRLCASPAWRRLIHEADRVRVMDQVGTALEKGEPYRIDYRIAAADGSVHWVREVAERISGPSGDRCIQGVIRPVNEERRANESAMERMRTDQVTGLAGRAMFVAKLAGLLGEGRETPGGTLIHIDLDHFRQINATLGRRRGDEFLAEVARRLEEAAGEGAVVARFADDEFGLLLPGVTDMETAAERHDRIAEAFVDPVRIGKHQLYVSMSAGVAIAPGDGMDPEELQYKADTALALARKLGGARYEFFSRELARSADERIRMEANTRRAVENQEFELYYQPQVDVRTGRVIGFESLLRWDNGGAGDIPPSQFLPFLEQSGLIVAVGDWALETVVAQVAEWRARGLPMVPVAVNLSARQFTTVGLVDQLRYLLRHADVPPELIELEITETTLMADFEKTDGILRELTGLGVGISIDDFGTGYSSLAYLKRFPRHTLKIDRTFMEGVPSDAGDMAIVSAVSLLAENLGMRVVAEGIETFQQVEFLRGRRCYIAQGYLFSEAVPSEKVPGILERRFDIVPHA